MRLVVVGATGRTGGEVVAESRERGHDVVGIARSADPDAGDGTGGGSGGRAGDGIDDAVPLRPPSELAEVLADVDAVVEFTTPEATREHAPVVAGAGVPYVVGTTGFDTGGLSALRDASERVPVLKAANFARGVQALLRAVEAGVAALPGYDVELTETHHSGKRDAPSGTARTVLEVVDAAREGRGTAEGDDDDAGPLERTYGREGEHVRDEREVGVHVRRAGTVRGEHELLLAGNDEVLTLTHRAESRRVFAAGALDAAAWLRDREPGWYDFADVL